MKHFGGSTHDLIGMGHNRMSLLEKTINFAFYIFSCNKSTLQSGVENIRTCATIMQNQNHNTELVESQVIKKSRLALKLNEHW